MRVCGRRAKRCNAQCGGAADVQSSGGVWQALFSMHPKEAAAAVAPFWARHVASERATLATSSQIIRPPRMCVLKKKTMRRLNP
jgi:hypothetical protein